MKKHFDFVHYGGLKNWIAKRNTIVWGLCIGTMLAMALMLRPAETVDFIYFGF
jgi:hypothetical protein